MNPELAKLVEQYLKGDKAPLQAATNTADNGEAFIAFQSAAAISKRLLTGLAPNISVQSFDGTHLGLGCGKHPPQLFSVSTSRALLPKEEGKVLFVYNLPSRMPAQVACKECLLEAQRNSVIKYGERVEVCAKHTDTILGARGLCPRCAENRTAFALSGEPVTYLRAEGRYSFYVCPMHGEFKVGHRAQGKCPVCDSIDGIAAYAVSNVGFNDRATLAGLKEMLAARTPLVNKHLSQAKRLAILALHRRLLRDPGMLHIFPTSKFLYGDWTASVEELTGLPLHFTPTAQQKVLHEVVAIEDAVPAFTKEDEYEVRRNDADDSEQQDDNS